MKPFVALTDKAWFDYLRVEAADGRLDEVNFWSPQSTRPIKRFTPGEPVFFRLKHPFNAVAGYGFFAHFCTLGVQEAWEFFGTKNGDPNEIRFRQRIGSYRGVDLLDPRTPESPMGCTVLRDARFWPESRWIPWGRERGWHPNVVRGATERDVDRAALLLSTVTRDASLAEAEKEWQGQFQLVDADARAVRTARTVVREGQGCFRARLLDAYGRRCAVTGERTEPVLDAAHIQPYLGPASNHLQNGLVLTKEFHTLFDAGLVGITPDLDVRISRHIRDRWSNGKRYYAYEGRKLAVLPSRAEDRPSPAALEWHLDTLFRS
ncbi:MAG: HNH endonuclease [Planctomycetota bacterium]